MTVIDAGDLDGGDLDEENAAGHVHGICLKTGPPQRVGVELEWLVRDVRDPALPVPAGRIGAGAPAFDAAPGTPGAQFDPSPHPADSLGDLVRATSADLAVLRKAAADVGLELAGIGLDPL